MDYPARLLSACQLEMNAGKTDALKIRCHVSLHLKLGHVWHRSEYYNSRTEQMSSCYGYTKSVNCSCILNRTCDMISGRPDMIVVTTCDSHCTSI